MGHFQKLSSMVALAVISMTLALVLYAVAFNLARSRHKTHITLASIAFVLDLYATYLMETKQLIAVNYSGLLLGTHISVSLLALISFLAVAAFGIFKKRQYHLVMLKWIFIPAWLASYLSGMYLIFG